MRGYLLLATLFSSMLISHYAFAECLIAMNFRGATLANGENFQVVDDAISGTLTTINIDGAKTTVSPGDLECSALDTYTALCAGVFGDHGKTIELYAVDESLQKVVFVQTRTNMPDIMRLLSGGKAMVGDLAGHCDQREAIDIPQDPEAGQ